jgi:hypothetical protein
MMRYLLLGVLLGALVFGCGCTYTVTGSNGPLAQCHDGPFTSFCVVTAPKGADVVSGTGIIPSIGGSAIGPATVARASGL